MDMSAMGSAAIGQGWEGFRSPCGGTRTPATTPTEAKPNSDSAQLSAQGRTLAQRYDGFSYQSAMAASVQITTAEGDIVTVGFSNETSLTAEHYQSMGDDTAVDLSRTEASQKSHLSFSVQGDINDDERDAIFAVLEKIDRVTHTFVSGNTSAALKQTLKLGFDEQQLAGFSFNLSQQTTLTQVATYQQVADYALATPTTVPTRAATGETTGWADFMAQLREVVTEVKAAKLFAAPGETVRHLAQSMLAQKMTEDPAGHRAAHDLVARATAETE